MTANEMKFAWLLKFEAMFQFSAPGYDDRQVGYLLTNAQLRIFKKYYNPFGNKYKLGFEANEKRRADLEQFIRSAALGSGITLSSSQTGVHPNGKFYDMPSDFLLAVEESAKLTGGTKEITVRPVKHDEYRANINNPYKNPYSNLVWRLDYSRADHGEDGGNSYTGRTAKRVELITDGSTITDYRMRYVISPPAIVVDEITPSNQRHCILDDTLHDDIIDEAVIIAKAAVNPQEYQVSLSEGQRSE